MTGEPIPLPAFRKWVVHFVARNSGSVVSREVKKQKEEIRRVLSGAVNFLQGWVEYKMAAVQEGSELPATSLTPNACMSSFH